MATPVSAETSVLVTALEHSRTVKSGSFRAAVLWGLLGVLCVFLTFFFIGIIMGDPARLRISGGVLSIVTCLLKCTQNVSRYQRASRDVVAYEAAFREEFASDPALDGLC